MDDKLRKDLNDLLRSGAYWLSLLLIWKLWSLWYIAYAPTNDLILYSIFAQIGLMILFSFVWYKIVKRIFK